VLQTRPEETFTRKKLLSCLLQTARITEAEEELHVLRSIEPASPEAAMGLGVLAVAQGRIAESRHYFMEIIARDPGHRDAQQFVALLDGSLGEPHRSTLCGMVRALAAASPQGAPSVGSPCP
jgi:Flp pilus assembly protein TadD